MPAIDSLVKILLAVVLGGVLGFERERRGRPAGLRTHILVCLASTLIMIVSIKFLDRYQTPESALPLPQGFARIAAGIVTGIGFLGAGTIINMRNITRGLTTAASIWWVRTMLTPNLPSRLATISLYSCDGKFAAELNRVLAL